MINYIKRYSVLFLTILIATDLSFAEERSNEELVTPRGNVYVGMDLDKLYEVFQEKDRILIPEAVLKRECHVFRDLASGNPNDTITFFVSSGKVTGWHKGYVASCQNKDSIYEYDNNSHIDIWFFPQDKARWDGAKVNLLDWNKLNQAQKIMFITEYIKQLNLQHDTAINVDIDKYILGMNYYSSNCPEECENIPASGAVNNLLVSDGKAASAKKITY